MTLRVSMERTQVVTWTRSPRQARDSLGEENGPGASVRGRWRRRQQGLEASQESLSPSRKGEVTKRLSSVVVGTRQAGGVHRTRA